MARASAVDSQGRVSDSSNALVIIMWRKSATSPFVLAAQLMCTLYCLIYTHPQTINQKAFELTRTTYFTKGCIVRLGAGERGVHSPLSESIPVKSYRDCDWIWKRTSA